MKDPVTAASILSEAGTAITSAMSTVWNIIVSNPILAVFAGASLLSLGFAFFMKAKEAARH